MIMEPFVPAFVWLSYGFALLLTKLLEVAGEVVDVAPLLQLFFICKLADAKVD